MRTVKVKLEADTEGFKTGVHSAKDSVKDLDDKVEALDHDLDKIPADAAKAAAAMRLLKGDTNELGKSIEQVGDRTTSLSLLDKRIADTRGEVKKLTEEFIRTGDVDVFHKLGKAQGDLSNLNNLRKKLSNVVEDGLKDGVAVGGKEAASTFSQLFEGGIIEAFKNPYVLAAAGVLAIAIGPLIGSAIGGSIIAAGAGGAVALGIAGAVQANPKAVGAAWDAEIARVKKNWLDASQSFVGPTISAIHILGAEANKIPLNSILSKASTYVEPLARGVAGFADGVARGVSALVDKAGPVIAVLKSELPEVGRAIEMSLSMIAGGNKGAADGLRDILHVLEAVIVGFGGAIRFTEDLYHGIKDIGDAIRGVTDQMYFSEKISNFFDPKQPQAYAVSLDGAAHGMDKYATETDKAKQATDELNDKIKEIDDAFSNVGKSVEGELTNKILDRMLALDDATLGWEESLAKLDDTAKKNGTSLDVLNEKTGKYNDKALANEKALLAAVKANAELYQQNLLSGMGADQAAAAYQHNSQILRQQAIDAGYNAKEVDNLIGKYGDVPLEVKTILATQGLTEALNHLGQILTDLNTLDKKTFTTKYYVDTYFNTYGGSYGGGEAAKHALPPGHRAGGGPVEKDKPYFVGEQGIEMFVPSQPGMILSADKTRQLAAESIGRSHSWAQGGGTMKFEHTVSVVDGSNGRSGLATLIAQMARTGELQITSRAIV